MNRQADISISIRFLYAYSCLYINKQIKHETDRSRQNKYHGNIQPKLTMPNLNLLEPVCGFIPPLWDELDKNWHGT